MITEYSTCANVNTEGRSQTTDMRERHSLLRLKVDVALVFVTLARDLQKVGWPSPPGLPGLLADPDVVCVR